MKTFQQGFTLIELMIVVAIIGILASLALPAYQDYVARSQMSEAFTSVEGIKVMVMEYGQTNGTYPSATTKPTSDSLALVGKYGSAVVTEATGVITVTMKDAGEVNARIAGETLTFTPPELTDIGTTLTFKCTSTVDPKYLPKSCNGS
ncbi:MAG TPA: pilin [Ideonella sp.]|uniref:pilin n=1 Tax=Ideonella sp. TaxID=1929293 RepID=UPI002C0D073E|nr:pilin [Ideonella sp.]HSI49938.1 pilin [Ideonella sp.]